MAIFQKTKETRRDRKLVTAYYRPVLDGAGCLAAEVTFTQCPNKRWFADVLGNKVSVHMSIWGHRSETLKSFYSRLRVILPLMLEQLCNGGDGDLDEYEDEDHSRPY